MVSVTTVIILNKDKLFNSTNSNKVDFQSNNITQQSNTNSSTSTEIQIDENILTEVTESNFKNAEINILTDNYNYETVNSLTYSFVNNIITIVKNFNLKESNIKSLPEMNYITIYYGDSYISLHYNNNDKDNNLYISTGNGEDYKCWISNTSDLSSFKTIVNNYLNTHTDITKNNQNKIIKKLSPSGWAGSSMNEVRLYDNGDVYHILYNGDGETDEYIIQKTLIARNANDIQEKAKGQAVEEIIIKGENLEVLKNDYSWIIYEDTTNP